MLSIEKYRKIRNDYTSSDEQVKGRLEYLHAFFRNIIRIELEKYAGKRSAIPQASKETAGRETSSEQSKFRR